MTTLQAATCRCDLPWYLDDAGNPTAQDVCACFEADASSLFCKHCEHALLCHSPAQEAKP